MTIPLTGPESLFVRLGHIFNTFNTVNIVRGTTIPPQINIIDADFQETNQDIVTNLYVVLQSFQNSVSGLPSSLQQMAQNVLTEMVNDDQKQTSLTSVQVCMNTLVGQMRDANETVKACVASSDIASDPSNNGNPNIIISLLGNDGLVQENSFAELIKGVVVSDSQSNNVVIGRETIAFQGQYAISDPLSWQYPAGSQAGIRLTCVDAGQSQGRGTTNNLNNSNFELWTVPNVPDAWHISVGTAGTTVKESTSVFYDGAASLEIVGNGSELTSLYQQFATYQATGDTSAIALSITQFAVNAWIKVDVVPAGGVLQFAFVDGTGTVINDEQGNPSQVSIDLTTVGTDFIPFSGFLRTPRVLPNQTRFAISLTTAIPSGTSLFIDRLALAQPVPAYPGGPSFAAFSGSNRLINGDSFEATIYNDYGGLFQRLFDRFYNMKQLGILLPSSNSPTIPDSLIS